MIRNYFMMLCFCLFLTGCSVVQATSGPESKDLTVLDPGTERYMVLSELGTPIATETDANGNKYDIFNFMQGQHGAVKAGKAVTYGAAAVLTLGLSEIITSPLEGAAGKGAKMKMQVVYDKEDKVKVVNVLQDDRWVPVQHIASTK